MTIGADNIPQPMLTVECVVFSLRGAALDVVLVRRPVGAFPGPWALPGGPVRPGETLNAAAARELRCQTGITEVHLEQFQAFDNPGLNPDGHSVTVAYLALIDRETHAPRPGDGVVEAAWTPMAERPDLVLNQNTIVTWAARRLRACVDDVTTGVALLPPQFTVNDLRRLYTGVFGETIDEWDFRRKVLALGLASRVGPQTRSEVPRVNGT